jgi:hypothetical protein
MLDPRATDAVKLLERSRKPRLVVLDEDGHTRHGLLCLTEAQRASASVSAGRRFIAVTPGIGRDMASDKQRAVAGSRPEVFLRRGAAWSVGFVFAGALYLLLIDITDLPELIVGAGAAAIAATGFELAREQQTVGGLRARLGWFAHAWRALVNVPSDIVTLSLLAVRQLVRPRKVNGVFRAVPFRCGDDESIETGRRALAESLGSFAPNTIIIGVDAKRELLLGHQLRRRSGDEAIDVLRLGSE